MILVLWNHHLAGPWLASDFRLQSYGISQHFSPKSPPLVKSKLIFLGIYFLVIDFFVNFATERSEGENYGTK
jgi:hypothetical protein